MTYHHMASLYDYLMKNAPYDHWVNLTTKLFKKHGKNIQHVIDLGCGTGEITIRLANKGYQLSGVDNSLEMLSYAEQKSYENNLAIQWFQQDLRELDGFTELDAAISYCDVINYITSEDELRNVFKRIFNLLKDGGLFIFDVHSLDYAQTHLMNKTFTEVTEQVSYIWDCIAGQVPGQMHHQLTFFSLDGDKYIRFDEFHHQRTYPPSFYKKLLLDTGFEKINIHQDFSLENEISSKNAERIFFLAIKRSR